MLNSIQIARALAVLGTMIAHLEWVYNDIAPGEANWRNPWLLIGGNGVDLFFCISGFIIAYLLNEREHTTRDFVARRVIRIYPIYWFFTLTFLGAVALGCRTGTRAECTDLFNLGHIVSSLLILPQQQYPVLSVGWSLEHEIIFYGIAAIVCVVYRLSVQRLLHVVLAMGGIGVVLHTFIPTVTGTGIWDYKIFSLYHFEFAAGIAVFLHKDWLLRLRLSPLPMVVGGIGAFCATSILIRLMPGPESNVETWRAGWSGLVSVLGFGFSSAVIISGLLAAEAQGAFRRDNSMQWRLVSAMVLIGNASYALYLMQPLAYGVLGKVLSGLGVSGVMIVPALIGAVVATLLLGCFWYLTAERPFLTYAHRVIAPRRAARPAA